MIISRTPFRMSFFGGGTDYPLWYRKHGGAVVSTTIDKYCYITCRHLPPFFDHKSRILYSKIETVRSNDQIEHPAVRAVLRFLKIGEGVEIHHDGDLPARTGLGSSSSFAVGLLHALHALRHEMPAKMQLAMEAIRIEQEVLREHVGCQDQVVAAVGGFQRIDFSTRGEIRTIAIPLSRGRLDELENHILLFFTGLSRIASVIAKEQLENMKNNTRQLQTMRQMVDEAVHLLLGKGSLAAFGKLLDEGWKLKRALSAKISTPRIDEMYDAAKSAGALGGKLLGAGGGGFLMIFAEPRVHARVKERLRDLLWVPFHFEDQGSQIIFYHPDAPPLGEAAFRRWRPGARSPSR